MTTKWGNQGNIYSIQEQSSVLEQLPKGIYKLCVTPKDELYLEQIGDEFSMPEKVYDIEQNLISTVLKTYQATKGNLGVLLAGVKGTGKSVTAKLISNLIELPVIIVPFHHPDFSAYLSKIQQECVVFFDEFEKIYTGDRVSIGDLLSVMDGALSNEYRKVFLLTTNSINVNENLLQRPGRIRYNKSFGSISSESVQVIIDDMLKDKSFANSIIDFISRLELVTVDIVTSLIEEVNIHGIEPDEFKDIFNVKEKPNKFTVVVIKKAEDGKETAVPFRKNCSVSVQSEGIVERPYVMINGAYCGVMVERISDDMIIVESDQYNEETDRDVKVLTTYQYTPYIDYSYNYRSLMM